MYWRTWIALPIANVVATGYLARARDANYREAALDLATRCDADAFMAAFGACNEPHAVARLVDAKTVTIPMLLKIAPHGTADPSPWLYHEVLTQFAAVGAIAAVCNVAAFRLPLERHLKPKP